MSKLKNTACMVMISALMLSLAACSKTNTNNTDNSDNTEYSENVDNNNSTDNTEVQQQEVVVQVIEANLIGVGAFQRQIKEALEIETVESIFDMEYQNYAQTLIDEYKASETYTLENPLFILNPFGTNRTGLYTYFTTKEAVNITYTVSVEDESIPDFTATLYSNEEGSAVTEHEGQLIGLIQGMENTIVFEAVNADGIVTDKTQYTVTVPNFGTLDKLAFKAAEIGDMTQLSEGLFTIMDYDLQDPEEYSHILVVDSYGVIRVEITLDAIKNCPVVEFIDGNFVFPYEADKLAAMNRLGKVERIYELGQYKYHHDMEYNASNNTLVILADDSERDTIEEIVVSLDMETGEVTLVADFEVLMADIKERATRPEKNMTYGTEFDWIHFNSVAFINDTDVLLSARELSSLIRVDNIYENPTITSIIADELIWADTAYEDLVYTKGNEFSSHAGQHNLTILHDDSLEDGQYYVTLFNNNWGNSPTWPEFDWSQIEGVNLEQHSQTEGYMGSAWYKYLVDDNTKTYTLVDMVELPYASFVSNSVQMENGNIAFGSGSSSKQFGEYDSNGNVIVQYNYDPDAFVGAYRAMKFSYKGFWFN